MAFNFKKYAGKDGFRTNWLAMFYATKSPNQVGVKFVLDQASCNPDTVKTKGSDFAVPDPRVNGYGKHDWMIISKSQFEQYKEAGTYCDRPGTKTSTDLKPGEILGIGSMSGRLQKFKSGWMPVECGKPEGVPNLPGIYTATGEKSDHPRYRAFINRWQRNQDVASAMRQYIKDNPKALTRKSYKERFGEKADVDRLTVNVPENLDSIQFDDIEF